MKTTNNRYLDKKRVMKRYLNVSLIVILPLLLLINVMACSHKLDYVKEFNKQFIELEKDKDKLVKEIDNLVTEVGATVSLMSVEPITGITATYLSLSSWKRDVALIRVKAEELRKRAYWLPDLPEAKEIKQAATEGCDSLLKWCDSSSQMFSDIQGIPKELLSVTKFEQLGETAVGQVKIVLDDWEKCEDYWTETQAKFASSRAKMDTLLKYRGK